MICSQQGHFAANCSAKKAGTRFVGKWAETTKQTPKSTAKAQDGQQNRANTAWPTPAEAARTLTHNNLSAGKPLERSEEDKGTQMQTLPSGNESTNEPGALMTQQASDSETLEMPSQLVKIVQPPSGPAQEGGQQDVKTSDDSMDSDIETESPTEKEENHKGVKRGPPQNAKDGRKKQPTSSGPKNARKEH